MAAGPLLLPPGILPDRPAGSRADRYAICLPLIGLAFALFCCMMDEWLMGCHLVGTKLMCVCVCVRVCVCVCVCVCMCVCMCV